MNILTNPILTSLFSLPLPEFIPSLHSPNVQYLLPKLLLSNLSVYVTKQIEAIRKDLLHTPHTPTPHAERATGPARLHLSGTEGLRTWELCSDISSCSPEGGPQEQVCPSRSDTSQSQPCRLLGLLFRGTGSSRPTPVS